MPASNPIAPQSSRNHVQFDYFSPQTAMGNVTFYDEDGGTGYFKLDSTNKKICVDTVGEYTSATGVTLDGVLLKDSDVTADDVNAADVILTGSISVDTVAEKTSAAGVTVDGVLLKDSKIPYTALPAYQTWVPTITCSGSMTYTSDGTNDRFEYDEQGDFVNWTFITKGTIAGTPDSAILATLPKTLATGTSYPGAGFIKNNSLWEAPLCNVASNRLEIYRLGAPAVWTAGAVEVHVSGRYRR